MREIAAGVRQLAGWPRDWLNVYLVNDVLLDTGTRWAERRILRQLRGQIVRGVALTHCHPDHQGTAAVLCRRFGLPLACHAADVAAMEGRSPMQPARKLLRFGERLWAGPAYPVERVLHDGDELAGFRVVHAPGHTPGHCLFFRAADRLAIAGDLAANISFLTGKPGLREPPRAFSSDPAENRRSLRKLLELQPAIICFGHGPPLRDLAVLERFVQRRRGACEAASGGRPF
jgi:hydroxyacylglutathione hydrolase